jgi:hypothetical protein
VLLRHGDRLSTYLNHHLAGATAGVDLARRIARDNENNAYGAAVAEIAGEIAADRAALEAAMERLGVDRDHLRQLTAWGVEKARRALPLPWLLDRHALGRLEELEALLLGVTGKLSLWVSLGETRGGDPRLDGIDLAALAGRARSQLERLGELRTRAAAETFGVTGSG